MHFRLFRGAKMFFDMEYLEGRKVFSHFKQGLVLTTKAIFWTGKTIHSTQHLKVALTQPSGFVIVQKKVNCRRNLIIIVSICR